MTRIVDREVVTLARYRFDECAACGERATNIHHVVQKGSPHFGDDVLGNLVGICGTGTSRCHGAIHGSPYVAALSERRDAEWVGTRIGRHIDRERPDVIQYVLAKLGDDPGRVFLERFYFLEVM